MRTLDDIKQQMIVEKNATPELANLNSSSATAIWKLWINIVALAIFTFEQIFEKDKQALINITERRRFGTIDWYASEVKKYQHDHQLTFNSQTGEFYYPIDDGNARIIEQSAVTEDPQSGTLTMKLARIHNGDLAPLESSQLLGVTNYIESIKVAGTNIELLSINPDIINIVADVYYDGNITTNTLKSSITTALESFKKNTSFNGVILKNDLINTIRAVAGVDDVNFTILTGSTSVGSPISIVRNYYALSGYFVFTEDYIDNWTFIPRYA